MKNKRMYLLISIASICAYVIGAATIKYEWFPYNLLKTKQFVHEGNDERLNHLYYKDRRFNEVKATLDRLRAGGLIVYMRHAFKEPITEQFLYSNRQAYDVFVSKLKSSINKKDYNGTMSLTKEGKLQCFIIHNAISKLGIKFREIYSSPTIRTRETAGLVFPNLEIIVDNDLIYPEIQTQKESIQYIANKKKLFLKVASGLSDLKENAFIVSHSSPTLQQLFDMPSHLDQGDCAILEMKDDAFRLVDIIKPLDWAMQLK